MVRTVMRRRRASIEPTLARMSKQLTTARRADIVAVLRDFAVAGGKPSDPDLWAMGRTT